MAKSQDLVKTKQAKAFVARLKELYPDAHCALHHKNAFELLVATILSAQCTDERVNKVTPQLFAKYPTSKALAAAKQEDVEKIIFSTGFYRNKAANLISLGKTLSESFAGEVPQDIETLVKLPGVGRKTANVVLGNAFALATGVVVDTHVGRLARRMGLTKHKDPIKVEKDLMKIVPMEDWILLSHLLIFHGRQVCFARSPRCLECKLKSICPQKIE